MNNLAGGQIGSGVNQEMGGMVAPEMVSQEVFPGEVEKTAGTGLPEVTVNAGNEAARQAQIEQTSAQELASARQQLVRESAPANDSLEEVQKYTEATLKPTLSVLQRRLNESGYPFYAEPDAKKMSGGAIKAASTWAGLSVARLYRREARLARYGVSSENLRSS